jgi:hypothetical protein
VLWFGLCFLLCLWGNCHYIVFLCIAVHVISVCERVYAHVVNEMIDCSILMSLWVTRVVYMIKSVDVGFL